MKWIFALLLPVAACAGDETLTAYAPTGVTFSLSEIDDAPFNALTTITLEPGGTFNGRAPCNSFSGNITVPYPWFATGRIAATRRACDGLREEQDFFATLSEMTLSEWSGDLLILSNDAGRQMVFTAQE
ncbi:hypothetical protein ACMU_00075 [Actibacterium mucosum KCTC 23349]|uniref:DUF306 domain-containing protein n=1 Tax=Actibacterium mucosum KCTC 23349 TaxID=1454373 RepID=A0A037ZKJ1_9RHOB|nr:META domain-containing protein [Actibacterium mucosum]KAJ56921.1 hypothetical protein ACMU_00075 [Actibacterium mucosum KCTC 23349]